MFPAPPMPQFASGQSAVTRSHLRFEDLAMDGRMIPIAMPSTLAGLWREVLTDHPGAKNAMAMGVWPILTRLVVHTTDAKLRVDRPVDVRAGFELAREPTNERLYMNVWSELAGPARRGGADQGKAAVAGAGVAGNVAVAGTVFAEHTFTRPLAPPGQRAVTALDVDGYPRLPDAIHAAPRPETAGDAPAGARWVDELAPDEVDHVFTLDDSDSNQHVNSLVYVRVFLAAANRRLAARGHTGKLRSSAIDIAYRKPSFPGDRVRPQLRLFELGERLGLAGHIAGSDGKPRCFVRVAIAH